MKVWAIVPAAGIGRRMQSKTPKQYLNINGRPIIEISIGRLAALPYIERIVVMLNPEDTIWPSLRLDQNPKVVCQSGGDTRYQSVLNGLLYLQTLASADDWVLVHDAARPCVRLKDIDTLLHELEGHPVGGLLGSPVDNTLKRVDSRREVIATVDRGDIWQAFTPQMFRFGLLLDALTHVDRRSKTITDEATAVELSGHKPRMVEGNRDNLKVTQPTDLELAGQILNLQALET
ncbi:MAG: 2-C-methyl-D-erythritol 4-phosphate cytidylyltransferase [Pseudohongiellaceae bacterium]